MSNDYKSKLASDLNILMNYKSENRIENAPMTPETLAIIQSVWRLSPEHRAAVDKCFTLLSTPSRLMDRIIIENGRHLFLYKHWRFEIHMVGKSVIEDIYRCASHPKEEKRNKPIQISCRINYFERVFVACMMFSGREFRVQEDATFV